MIQHLKQRITDKNKQDHWVLKWCKKNLPVVTLTMLLFDYLNEDVNCLDETATLLTKPSKFLLATSNTKSTQQGAYMYYNNNNMKLIRSGKVTMRGFSVRHEEHKEKAIANRLTSTSKF
eukprot:8425885-Ditylum_brightwellii.AAC.1